MDTGLPAMGICPKCNGNMIIKGNGLACLDCDKPPLPNGYIKPKSVGNIKVSEEDLKGIIKNNKPFVASQPVQAVKRDNAVKHTANDALEIMRNLPMPKDEKEFKKIRKIIQLLEKFVEGR